jgi:hypothetical protein
MVSRVRIVLIGSQGTRDPPFELRIVQVPMEGVPDLSASSGRVGTLMPTRVRNAPNQHT